MNMAHITRVLLGLLIVAPMFLRDGLANLLGPRLTVLGIFAFILLALLFPFMAGFIAFLVCGFWVFYGAWDGLRRGSIAINARVRFALYTRQGNPAKYWFWIFLFGIDGLALCAWAIYFALHLPIFHLSHEPVLA